MGGARVPAGGQAGDAVSRVDFCVTTMDRPRALARVLLSVAEHHPGAPVHIADQSERFDPNGHERLAERLRKAGLREPPTVHRLPFDCGVSAARNHLADSTLGEYKLLLDDDFELTERTEVEAMVGLLDAHPRAGVVGGGVTRDGRVRNVGTRLERWGSELRQLPTEGRFNERDGLRFERVDCVPLFALMRGEVFRNARWDPELKTAGEHLDFFLRLREAGYEVLYAPDVTVDHPPTEADERYRQLRQRDEFLKRMLAKHGLRRLRAINGSVFELGDHGELTRRREEPVSG